jgi:uncharacterized protein (TIGR02284 family)
VSHDIQTGTFVIHHCSLLVCDLAVCKVRLNRRTTKRRAHAARDTTHFYMKKENTVLNNLIETLKDGQEGFKQAADGVSDPKLKSLFSNYSDQRSRFATALQSEARRHGETEPETSSSATGALHRGWINLKSAITGGDEHAILAECERGEDSAVEEYKKALDDGLSPSAQDLVSRQFAEIKAVHDRIRSLRDATKS